MRLGFIGGWGHSYLSGLIGSDIVDIEEVGYAGDGIDQERAQLRAQGLEKRGAKVTWFDRAQDMLDRFKPDMVNVGAVYGHNGEFAAQCLERDIPTSSDKPVAGNWQQYERLVELTKNRPGRVLVTEFPFRSDPAMRAARDAVRQGLIGPIALANGQKSYKFGDKRPEWYGDRGQYTGTILWVAGHAIDFVWFVTGLDYVRVYGQQGNVSRRQYGSMEEVTINVFDLSNGGHAIVHADYNRPAKAASHGDDRLRLMGGKGQIDVVDGRCLLTTHEAPQQDITDRAKPASVAAEMYEALQGRNQEIYGTAMTLKMGRILLLARDAADQRKVVELQ